jgi:hypothetical protein
MEGWEESSSGPRKGVKGLIGRDWGNEGIGREKPVFIPVKTGQVKANGPVWDEPC